MFSFLLRLRCCMLGNLVVPCAACATSLLKLTLISRSLEEKKFGTDVGRYAVPRSEVMGPGGTLLFLATQAQIEDRPYSIRSCKAKAQKSSSRRLNAISAVSDSVTGYVS
jgi:hypothetical protein